CAREGFWAKDYW
nr:immunoglobulin heavy chain junction region [Mus musculus]